jgi:hypothetical protein
MVDQGFYRAFEAWFSREVENDPEWAGLTAQQAIAWALRHRLVDVFLMLPTSGKSWREYISINHQPWIGSLQPEGGRVGGDHDRGFSPALNKEMRRRIETLAEGTEGDRPKPDQGNHRTPVRPPLKKISN